MGHSFLKTTMIYTQVLKRSPMSVISSAIICSNLRAIAGLALRLSKHLS
jgi:hypothetical protein